MINPDALLGLSLSSMAVLDITGQRVPEWLVLLSLGVSVVSVAHHASNLIVEPQERPLPPTLSSNVPSGL